GELADPSLSTSLCYGDAALTAILSCAPAQTLEKLIKFKQEITIFDAAYRPAPFRRIAKSTVQPSQPIPVPLKRTAEGEVDDEPSAKRRKQGSLKGQKPKARGRKR
ncbi:hypothetical protein R3P38DRAFT_2588299, partial [Favolaschia claudopus]